MKPRRQKIFFLFVLPIIGMILAACSVPAPVCDQTAIRYPAGRKLAGGPVRLGVIDASPRFTNDLPEGLRATQASLAVLDDVRWGYIEPNAPQNGSHAYVWDSPSSALDTRVAAYQQAGFELVMVLRAWNPWARSFGPQGGQAAVSASTPPKSEYLDDYAAWVQAVVERYDADGVDDFPGLVDVNGDGHPDPVRFFQIETDATTGVWWQGASPETTASDYVTLLRAAAGGVRAASPEARVILAGAAAADMLDRWPSATDLEDIVTHISPDVCGAITAFQQSLAAADAYDIVAVHSMGDYSGLATLADWTATVAGEDKPVWLTGATTAPALTADPAIVSVNPLFPGTGEALWESLKDVAAPDHDAVLRWYRAEQARLAFKKWVMAAANGFSAVVMGYEQDRPGYQNPSFGLRDLAFQGMLGEAGDGPPEKHPVVYALAMAQGQLGGYGDVLRMPGFANGVYAYAFDVEGQSVYALWYDDGVAQGPDDAPASLTISLRTPDAQLLMFTTPTQPGQTSPDVQTLVPVDGVVTLTLTETPVVIRGRIEPQAQPQLFFPFVQG